MKTQIIKFASFFGVLFMFFTACSQDDESMYRLNTRLVELNCKGTQSLQVTPTLPGLSYTSLNTNIATVSPEGLVTAKLVGTTKIVVKDSLNLFLDTVNVVVGSVNTLFDDPYLGFGTNNATLLTALNITDYRFLYPSGGGFCIDFNAKNYTWTYKFSDENKLIAVRVHVSETNYVQLESYLSDRYQFMITKQYGDSPTRYNINSYYISPDSSLIVEDFRYSVNDGSSVSFYPATQEKIQLVLSDETNINPE